MSARPSAAASTLRAALFRVTPCLLLLFALSAARPPGALGHAAFLDSTPHAGVRVQSSPPEIILRFTEPLNPALSKATIADARTGRPVATTKVRGRKDDELRLRPGAPLARAPYRVAWHTVSTVDGHALEGSFSFGVRTAAVGGEHTVEQSPLARGGWLRIALRALFYAALFFFAGGVLNAALLSRREPAGWLVPVAVDGGKDGPLAARAWGRTLDAGLIAAAAAAATTLAEAADAGGHLTASGAHDYLLTNAAGLARVGTVGALAISAFHARRTIAVSAAWLLIALMTIALSGHANSADPRAPAVLTDWMHLIAASIWVGGIGQIALTWFPWVQMTDRGSRSTVMKAVLDRFGRVALPAFLVVAASGLVNALIELGYISALWQTTYGRVLAAKIGLVGVIALASYWHALRLRPRLLAANPHPPERLERRHWRLLSSEPLIAVAVVGAAAALVAFPLPPRQLGATDEARAAPNCDPCPLPAARNNELSVADRAGSRIAAFWLRREGDRLSGTVRLLDDNARPVDAPIRLLGGKLTGCSRGCWRFGIARAESVATVAVSEGGKTYRASVPTVWQRRSNARARALVRRAQDTMRRLSSVVEDERLTSGPGTYVRTLYRLEAPDRFTYRTSSGAASIVIGKRQWDRVGHGPWQAGVFGGLSPFRTRGFFRWTPYARSTRLLGLRTVAGRRVAEVALMDQATPIWFRLLIDLQTKRVLRDRMITNAHFMSRRYLDFDAPLRIEPPARSFPSS
jgi:copper transport protein